MICFEQYPMRLTYPLVCALALLFVPSLPPLSPSLLLSLTFSLSHPHTRYTYRHTNSCNSSSSRILVFPAASRPSINILMSFFPKSFANAFPILWNSPSQLQGSKLYKYTWEKQDNGMKRAQNSIYVIQSNNCPQSESRMYVYRLSTYFCTSQEAFSKN